MKFRKVSFIKTDIKSTIVGSFLKYFKEKLYYLTNNIVFEISQFL